LTGSEWSTFRPALLSSRPGEFHPEPLTDPDVTLSRHLVALMSFCGTLAPAR
jgi:hypothetical protein